MSTETMTKTIAEYFKTQPVLKAWLFGSFARGEETPCSDVDILFVPDYSSGKPLSIPITLQDLSKAIPMSRLSLTESPTIP